MSRLQDSIAEHVHLYRDHYLGKESPQRGGCRRFTIDWTSRSYDGRWRVIYALVMDTKAGRFCFTRRFECEFTNRKKAAKVLHSIDILSSSPARVMAHWDGFATEDATHPSQQENS